MVLDRAVSVVLSQVDIGTFQTLEVSVRVWAMTGDGRRNFWLRMTDSIGVTEPGKKPARLSPRILVLQIVGYTVMTVAFTALAFWTQDNIVYLIAAALSLIVAVASLVMWIQYMRSDHSKPHGNPEADTR